MSIFKRRVSRVYVLGAGPAGLLAAQAAKDLGYTEVSVISQPGPDEKAQKSTLHGCQYLHQGIPGIAIEEPVRVSYTLEGTIEQYRAKVYGANWQGSVSPDEYGPEKAHLAWNLRTAYERLWGYWQGRIVPMNVSAASMGVFANDPHAMTLSTIPAPALCRRPDEHKFVTQEIWAMGSTGRNALPFIAPPESVQCNGQAAPRWYRAATVFGASTVEWPAGPKPPISGIAAVSKPLSTDCYCWSGKRYHRLGRYGKWSKGVLAHSAYYEALELLA